MSEIFYEVMRDYTNTIYHNVGINNSLLHFHQHLEILYVEEGQVEVTINDTSKILTKGQVAIIDSFDNHQYTHIDNSISRCLIIPATYLKKYSTILSNKIIKENFIVDESKCETIYNNILNVVSHIDGNELKLEGTILLLLGEIIENNLSSNPNKASYDLIKSILIYIENNYKNPITLDTIAQHFGYSKYYFSHLFNKCFRCNLNDYLNLVRCRHSINCVIDDHMSVSDAAYSSGFVSMRTFYRTFKKYFKITPKEYFHQNKK